MARTEYALLGAVGALALFVCVEVARAPGAAQQVAPHVAPADDSAPAARTAAPHADMSARVLASVEAAPAHDVADIRGRLTSGAPGTYMPAMLADDDSMLVRWPDRRLSGLRVWVQPTTAIGGWSDAYPNMARAVFDEWLTTGLPLRFDFVYDSASADVRVTWLDRFPPSAGRRIGATNRGRDRYGWLVAADIVVALHDSAGRDFAPEELTGIVRHEVGHALGLGHSTDRGTMMYPESTVNEIAPADRATLRLLYSLPPGSVK